MPEKPGAVAPHFFGINYGFKLRKRKITTSASLLGEAYINLVAGVVTIRVFKDSSWVSTAYFGETCRARGSAVFLAFFVSLNGLDQ